MCRNQHLKLARRILSMIPKLSSECLQKLVIKTVLWLFDAHKSMWFRIE